MHEANRFNQYPMTVIDRVQRHARLSLNARGHQKRATPPFMIVFINSICNLTCEHCFYWRNLNQRNDLTFEEFQKLSLELGEFEQLNLSGGEPFLRPEFAEICDLFLTNNGVKRIYVPTNGYFTGRTQAALRSVLQSATLVNFVCEISLDGMPEYHNRFRGNAKSFAKAMETYALLAEMQQSDPRLRIHANTVAMSENMEECWRLTEYLRERCPSMEHHNLAVIRGDRKNPSLQGPALEQYKRLYNHVAEVWKTSEETRFGAIVEPMLQWAKVKTIETNSQYVPCTAGNLTGVVYANGDISVCETHPPIGNLRQKSFFEIWDSEDANTLRAQIKAKQCYCTNEVFLWPSIVFQPLQLTKALVAIKGAKAG
ncbi:MAG TPA: radical SAM protein [Bryobacteraceae bacterium]|jgi:MoaA/NifB/PqqE/SkfB family radical SAM enzyme|nr:radical SAM protein [Bryobacteraceae bacterium]